MDVALLGTGLLGRAVAERLHATGHNLSAYNRSAEKTLPLCRLGIRIAQTAEDAISHAKAVLLLLADAAAIRALLFDQATRRVVTGRTIIQMGTIGPSESGSIRQEIEQLGGRYLEAPVLGDRKSTRLNSSHQKISYAVFCLK